MVRLWLVIALVGCGGSDELADSAPADASGGLDGAAAAPDIPWLGDGVPPIAAPVLVPCPTGWREVGPEPVTCEPYPEGGALDCPTGQAHFPGEAGCVPVGATCPAGDFADGLPTDRRVVYVQPGATGGDGSSPATPYGGFGEFALGALPSGSVIALSRGTHAGPVTLARGLVLWGACAAETALEASEPSVMEGVVTVRGGRGELRDLTVSNSPRLGALLLRTGSEMTMEGVVFVHTEWAGVAVTDGGRLTAQSVVFRDIQSRSDTRTFGRGVNVESGGAVELTRAAFERVRELGAFAGGAGTSLTMSDVVIRDTQSQEIDSAGGKGVAVEQGAAADVSRALLARNRTSSVIAEGDGAAVVITDSVVRETQSEASTLLTGRGLGAQRGGVASATRVVFEGSTELGVFSGGAGASVMLTDAIVRDTRSQVGTDRYGRGLSTQEGATAEVARGLFERNRDLGVFASLPDTTLSLTDVVVRDTDFQLSDGTGGRALNVQDDATADVTRALFERSREVGLFADLEATVSVADVVVRDTTGLPCIGTTDPETCAGFGVTSVGEASIAMTRFIVIRSELCGVILARDGFLDLSHGEVREAPVGVCLQVDGYDIGRLMNRVRFADNGENLQSTTLPVPESAVAIP